MTQLWARAKAALQRLRYTEPALLRARVVQLLGLAVTAGVTVPGYVDHWVGAAFAVLTIAAPYYQGRRTRADVWSQKTVDDLAALVATFPGLADKAKQLLGKGLGPTIVREMLEQLEARGTQPTVQPGTTAQGSTA